MHAFDTRFVRARSPHRCSLCGRPIPEGKMYYAQATVWDGRYYMARWHPTCALFEEFHGMNQYDDCPPNYSDLLDATGGEDLQKFLASIQGRVSPSNPGLLQLLRDLRANQDRFERQFKTYLAAAPVQFPAVRG